MPHIARTAATGLLLSAFSAYAANAQNPLRFAEDAVEARFARSQPVVHYLLRVDSADLSGFAVEMRIRNAPDTFSVAMAAHPEYDDRYWRYVEGARVDAPAGAAAITRVDSALWHVRAPGGASVIRYRLHLPPPEAPPQPAWKPFLDRTGAVLGGPHAFMYILGATLAPSHVSLDLPSGWSVATGLAPTADPLTFYAPSIDVLVDSPILAGRFSSWRFAIDGVPHRVAYWPMPDAKPFDSVAFVDGVRRLTEQATALFGRPPWRDYTFMFRDGAWGGLEHASSVTLGVSSASLAQDVASHLPETAHEFFHAWNLVRIRPAEYRGVSHRPQPPSAGLWFSEGVTMFYADLLLRRAGLPAEDSTRIAHLESLITRYLANPGHARLSAERVSRAEYGASPAALGDYTSSPHLQGEVMGAMLDLVIRDATNGRRSMDDGMRLMLERYAGARGFLGGDVERVVAEVCSCNVTPFFDAHVRGAARIDFDRYLRLIGLDTRVTWGPALDGSGKRAIDLTVWGYTDGADNTLRLRIGSPDGVWGRAGLHTGDRVVAVNDRRIRMWPELRSTLLGLSLGDTVRVDVERPSGRFSARVIAAGFDAPTVRIAQDSKATDKARRLRAAWVAGR